MSTEEELSEALADAARFGEFDEVDRTWTRGRWRTRTTVCSTRRRTGTKKLSTSCSSTAQM